MEAHGHKERERERERAREKDRDRDYYDDNRRDRDRYRERDNRQTSSNKDSGTRRPANGKARKGQAAKRQTRQDSDYDYSPSVKENSRGYRKKPLNDAGYKDDRDSYDPVYEPVEKKQRPEPRGRKQGDPEPYSAEKADYYEAPQDSQAVAKKKKPKKKKDPVAGAGGQGYRDHRRDDEPHDIEYVPVASKQPVQRIQQPAPRAKDYYYERKY